MDVDKLLYIYAHIRLDTGGLPQFSSLNPWTCTYYVAKAYAVEQQEMLEAHLQLVKRIPVSLPKQFIRSID
jgi:hypothetical protein